MPDSSARLPAEWEPQSGVMLTWPHEATDWGDRLGRVYPVFATIGAAIATHQSLLSVCRSPDHADRVRELLSSAGARTDRLRFAIGLSDDTWARDHGPLTVIRSGVPTLLDFRFNGWGGKLGATNDDALSCNLHRQHTFGNAPMQSLDFVLEGGAVETDGRGTLLATRASVISATRNPGLDQQAIEQRLQQWLGLDRFLWLDHGDISGDDTDGHIDTLARFTDASTIVYATAPAGDPDHAALSAMAEQLRDLRDRNGRPYRLLPLPFPGVHRDRNGRRLPATYANFLIINGAVLLPVYGVAQDRAVISVLQTALPDRRVVPIDCGPIIEQNGSLHCLTMQFPAAVSLHDKREFDAA